MPHVIVKLYPGDLKRHLKNWPIKIAEDVSQIVECERSVVSVAVEEIDPSEWAERVYRKDILECSKNLVIKPGYDPFASKDEQESDDRLMDFVRQSAAQAQREDTSGFFNPMSWLDLELEEKPRQFDSFFKQAWDTLTDAQKADRAKKIRSVL
jgi:4-oxalocrotonate tautomerase